MPPIDNPAIAEAFAAYPPAVRVRMLELRALILATAAATEGVGELDEALKWGEPAFLTTASKSGSTVRIDWKPKAPRQIGVYFNCQTALVDSFRARFPVEFAYAGNRAILLPIDEDLPAGPLAICIAAALTYHRDKSSARARAGGNARSKR